jgi:hypothetical protein
LVSSEKQRLERIVGALPFIVEAVSVDLGQLESRMAIHITCIFQFNYARSTPKER